MTRRATPWSLPHRDQERERSLTALQNASARAQAAEREEQWHAARLVRSRYLRPESWLDCLGLLDVPDTPDGWCTCPAPRPSPPSTHI